MAILRAKALGVVLSLLLLSQQSVAVMQAAKLHHAQSELLLPAQALVQTGIELISMLGATALPPISLPSITAPHTQSLLAASASIAYKPAPCLFGSFNGSLDLTGLVVDTKTVFSEQACRTQLQNNPDLAIGYVYRPFSCQIITALPTDLATDAGICVRRGGCSGTGDNTSCVWLDIPSASLSNLMTSYLHRMPLTTQSCKSLCELDPTCIAYSYAIEGSVCTLFNSITTPSTVAPATAADTKTGFCLPVLQFTAPPSMCFKNRTCLRQPLVAVPKAYGDAKVVIEKYSGLGELQGPIRARSSQGVASFNDIGFSLGGRYVLQAWAQDVPCPAFSTDIVVTDRDLQTLVRYMDGDFPKDGFLIMRFQHDCPKIAMIIAIMGAVCFIVAVSTLLSILTFSLGVRQIVGKALFLGLAYVVFQDLVAAWNTWKCSSEYGSKLKGSVKIQGMSVGP